MNKAELFLLIQIPNTSQAAFDENVALKMKDLNILDNLMIVAGQESETTISFSYDIDNSEIDFVFKMLADAECKIVRIYLHISKEISQIGSEYDAAFRGQDIQNRLKEIKGIAEAVVAVSGTIKIEIEPDNQYGKIVSAVLSVINAFTLSKNNRP